MRVALTSCAACLVAIALANCASGGSERSHVHFRKVASGFQEPVFVGAPRSEPGKLYVVEQAGRVWVLANGRKSSFLDIRGRVEAGGEEGLLSIAFHPDYAKNHRFFVYYTDRGSDISVDEFRSKGGKAVLRSRRTILHIAHPYTNHNGGQLGFGPDGRLYAGTGDGGSGGDPGNRAQNLRSRLGKLLRLNVNRRGAKWQLAAYGLRNPWRFSWDRKTGDLYIGDVGQSDWEEIDFRAPQGQRTLTNYGWSAYEGRARYNPERLNRRGKLVFPVVQYSHSKGCSVTGGYVYRGSAVAAAKGRYFYGDYCTGTVWSTQVVGGKARGVKSEANVSSLSSFGEDAAGELYAVSTDGGIFRLTG
ncbi:MAG: PQQ-dependent sugar dehydrogenase [Actinomycetota bacterium]|nr:PQQ-dependent sugar dehydrogenase [Actinomycetota bacterium]